MSLSHPQHLAVIMDGNRRWAKREKKSYQYAYNKGVESAKRLILSCKQHSVAYVSLFVFSTENWRRPKSEVDFIISLLSGKLKKHYTFYAEHDIKVVYSGSIEALGPKAINEISKVTRATAHHKSITVNLACNYGGRNEIIRATHRLLEEEQAKYNRLLLEQSEGEGEGASKESKKSKESNQSKLSSASNVFGSVDTQENLLPDRTNPLDHGTANDRTLTESQFYSYFDQPDFPDIDLVVRTGGERRLSNFCLWQMAYSELHFTDVLWPDWQDKDFEDALEFFHSMKRNFGS